MIKALSLGVTASFFFAFTFVLNRRIQVSGGHWIWSSSLRFFFMLPMLFPLLVPRKRYRVVFTEIRKNPYSWFLWSTVGFGIFYASISMAASYGPSWLIASTWQITIVAGALLTPLFYETDVGDKRKNTRRKMPIRQLAVSAFILAGVALVQAKVEGAALDVFGVIGMLLIVVAAFAYPLGNRKMMNMVPADFGTIERIFGMTLCSMPFWAALSIAGIASNIMPSRGQLLQTFLVALFSGVVATILFFKSTELVRNDPGRLAVVESTQAGEVVFALIGGLLLSDDPKPSIVSLIGILIIIIGIALNGFLARKNSDKPA